MARVDDVSPLQGTNSHFEFSYGNTLPLTSAPWAMTGWSPQTDEGRWLFSAGARRLQGFRATHQPSPWIADYGALTVMPLVGDAPLDAQRRASVYRPDQSVIRPDYLRATLGRYRTTVELAPTERGAIFRISFPAAEAARVLLQPLPGASEARIDPDARTVTVTTRANSGGAPPSFACHYVATFDRPFAAWATVAGTAAHPGELARSGERIGALVTFAARDEPVVTLRIASSFISPEQARLNLARELGDLPLEEVRERARAAWDELLGLVEVEGATPEQRATLATCLYRSLLFPRVFHEQDAAGRAVHYSPYSGDVRPGVMYADNGFWDTFRTVYPLLSILLPERLAEMIEGWTNAAKEGGWFPTWASPGYRACMIGTHLDAIVADAYLKGVRGFDAEAAYAAVRRDATEEGDPGGLYGRKGQLAFVERGYVPADLADHAAARTQEYAYTDWCAAQLARALGRREDDALFRPRALHYRNVFDPATGLMRARTSDGAWLEPFDEFAWDTRAYIEGSAWQYSWQAPHDPAGLVALHGGPDAFCQQLDRMLALPPRFEVGGYGFEIHEMTEMAAADFGQYAHSNQPVHHALYLYAAAGKPWRTQYWVRRVLDELYGSGPNGLPGDEDNGEMCAWYVLSALGIYPLCPGAPQYVLGSPLFPRATIRLPGGRALTVEAAGHAPGRVYVKETRFNGAPHTPVWIEHEALARGGTLTFVMDDQPATDRALRPEDLPYSASAEG